MAAGIVLIGVVTAIGGFAGGFLIRDELARKTFDRRCRIVNALRGGKRSTANEICGRINVRTGTIHADLAALVRGGLVVREESRSVPYDRFLYRLRTDEEASRG